jgi:DNA invertase Pin-like site-specific DNA recombinase
MSSPVRPAAYVRVIGARNANDPHVRSQAQVVLEAARLLGWPRPAVYVEIGLPGWRRPGSALGRLVGSMMSGGHDAVIVANLSRISRDPAEVLDFAWHCIGRGLTIHAVEEGSIDQSRLASLYARR